MERKVTSGLATPVHYLGALYAYLAANSLQVFHGLMVYLQTC